MGMVQALFGGFAFIGALISVSFMPVADALVVMFSDPLVTMIVASIFLEERLNLIRISTGSLIIVGVTLVCRPPFLFGSSGGGGNSSDVGGYINCFDDVNITNNSTTE